MRFVASTVLLALLVSDCCTAASLEGLNPSSGEEADYNDEILAGSSEDVMVGCGCDSGSTRQGNWDCGCGNNDGYNPGYNQQFPRGLTGEHQGMIVNIHNDMRRFVAAGNQEGQPPAQNMKELDWNDQLAWRAQRWADQCLIKHDPHKQFYEEKFGQNIGWNTTFNGADSVSIVNSFLENGPVQAWFNEVKNYRFQPFKPTQRDAFDRPLEPVTGHYTQQVWANTNSIGCGLNTCQYNGRNGLFLVCNYYPAGNYIGQFPYEIGNTECERFNMGPSSYYEGLCRAYN